MKKAIYLLTTISFAIVFSHNLFGQDSLVSKTFLGRQVQLSVPASFTELDPKTVADRFPDPGSRPAVIMTDKEELCSIKIIEMPHDVADNEVGQYKVFHMKQMNKEPNIQWIGDGVKKINGKNVGFIKVIYTEKNTFAYFFFTSLKGALILFSYTCVDKLWPSMEESIEHIVNSLKVE